MSQVPLMPGDWQPLDEDESRAFLERLGRVLAHSHGDAAFTRRFPVTNLRAMPLTFYPGWLLVEGEALVAPDEVGTFDVLYGPGLLWVVDGESATIHELNAGRIPRLAGEGLATPGTPAFVASPLARLDDPSLAADYVRFWCGAVWGDQGPFWPVESVQSPLLENARFEGVAWRERIAPMRVERSACGYRLDVAIAYGTALFEARFELDGQGLQMENDDPIGYDVLAAQRYRSPFRNLRASSPGTAGGHSGDAR